MLILSTKVGMPEMLRKYILLGKTIRNDDTVDGMISVDNLLSEECHQDYQAEKLVFIGNIKIPFFILLT